MQMSMLLSFKNWLVKIDHDGIFLTPSVNMMDFNKVERNRRWDTQQWPTKDPSAHTDETEMLHLKKIFKTFSILLVYQILLLRLLKNCKKSLILTSVLILRSNLLFFISPIMRRVLESELSFHRPDGLARQHLSMCNFCELCQFLNPPVVSTFIEPRCTDIITLTDIDKWAYRPHQQCQKLITEKYFTMTVLQLYI